MLWHILSLTRPETMIPLISNPDLKTGDLVLFRHNKYRKIPILGDRIISHVAIIWNNYVVDINPTFQGPYLDESHIKIRGDAIVLYDISTLYKYPGDVLFRHLKIPLTEKQHEKFDKALEWALQMYYDESIVQKDILTYASFVTSIIFPELSYFLAEYTPLSFHRMSIFCTELVNELLRRSGISIKSSHYYGPIGLLSGYDQNTLFGPEFQLIK